MVQLRLSKKPASLAGAPVYAVVSTTNAKRARRFYEKVLGLELTSEDERGELMFTCGNDTQLLVYERSDPPMAQNTALGFQVDDLDAVLVGLSKAGIQAEEYDVPGLKTVEGVVESDGRRAAWIRDPDGNIIALSEGT